MSLFDAYTAVVTALPGFLPGAGFFPAGMTAVTCHFGPEYLVTEEAPPRIVWVPTMDRFDGPAKGGQNPRDIYSVPTGVDIHLWGADAAGTGVEGAAYRGAMQLRDAVLNAMHAKIRGVGFSVTQGLHPATDQAVTRYGWLYVLSITVGIPVVRPVAATATPAGVTFPLRGH